MTIYEQALELGRQIAKSEPFKKMKDLEQQVMADDETRKLVEDLEKFKLHIQDVQRRGGGFNEEDLERFKRLEEKAMANSMVSQYYQSRTDFHETAEKVNAKMREGLNEGN